MKLSHQLVIFAARLAPRGLKARLEEEWLAHLAELGGGLARLRFATGCLWAAGEISIRMPSVAKRGHRPMAGMIVAAAAPAGAVHAAARDLDRPSIQARRWQPPVIAATFCEINITPLIDVMLVLVVTLVVSLPISTHRTQLVLQPGEARQIAVSPPVLLVVDFDDSLAWNGVQVTGLPQLETYLRAVAHQQPQPEIRLQPDRRASYNRVAQVLAAAQRNGATRIDFGNTADFGPGR